MAKEKNSVYNNPTADKARKLQEKVETNSIDLRRALNDTSKGYYEVLGNLLDTITSRELDKKNDIESAHLLRDLTKLSRQLFEYTKALTKIEEGLVPKTILLKKKKVTKKKPTKEGK